MFELLPASFCCSTNLNLSHSSLGSDDKNIVEIPEAVIAGDLSNSTIDLSLGLFQSMFLKSKFISFANSPIIFRSFRFE